MKRGTNPRGTLVLGPRRIRLIRQLSYTNDVYRTAPDAVSLFARVFPSLAFYRQFTGLVFRSSAKAKRGEYGYVEWSHSSLGVLRALERVGVRLEITGISHLAQLETPCVVIGNHMSLLETVVLPGVIQPVRNVTFVVKQSLLEYPVFKHVMRSRDPIAVSRTNPRQDLKAVLEGGKERLSRGISIIIFPQTTRTNSFDPAQFSTIGVKLAARAKVPVVPLALLSDAWRNGKFVKDLGRIDPSRRVRFAFGEPMPVEGRGGEEHQAIIRFISGKLREWRDREGIEQSAGD